MESNILDRNLGPSNLAGSWVDVRPNGDRAKAAIVLVYIMIVLDIAFVLLSFNAQSMAYSGSYDENLRNAMILGGAAILYLAGFIVGIIMFIRWFRRAYYNLHQIDGSLLSRTEGWAAGAWFVPLLNLVWPFTIMQEIVSENDRHAQRLTGNSCENVLPLVNWWWGLWIGQYVLGMVNNFLSDFELVRSMTVVTHLLYIIAGIILAVIIRRVSVMERAVYDNRERAGLQTVAVSTPSFNQG